MAKNVYYTSQMTNTGEILFVKREDEIHDHPALLNVQKLPTSQPIRATLTYDPTLAEFHEPINDKRNRTSG